MVSKPAFYFGTVGSPGSTPKKPGGSVGAILHLANQSLMAYELGWVRSIRVSEETCAIIKQTAEEAGVNISVHAPYYINLNADREEWPRSRKRLMEAAHYGDLAGATDIVFHPGSYFGGPPEEALEVALPRLRGCVEELRFSGNQVTLRPETMGKEAMLGSLEDTLILSQEIEGVEPCLDFAHLHARPGDGSMNSYTEWRELLIKYGDTLGSDALQRLHCHLSGIEYGSKGERNHLMLSDSDFNLEALIQALVDLDCQGRILCESPQDMDVDAQYIKETWERISGI
ncbi:MAG TPA: TIM barrel protein [Anaerolineae bacterium]|nr:TIM barrel protein [Anaerolineae bacterium]